MSETEFVSISSPSNEGGGQKRRKISWLINKMFPLVLLQTKVVGLTNRYCQQETPDVSISSPSNEGGGLPLPTDLSELINRFH